MLRQRKKSSFYAVEVIKQLDSFPKVNKEDFIERSRFGGTGLFIDYLCYCHSFIVYISVIDGDLLSVLVTVIAQLLIVWIIFYELGYYFESDVDFKFMPDTQYDAKLSLNLDIVVAMPCHSKTLF